MESGSQTPTQLLAAASAGDHDATEQLLPLVYDQLRSLASSFMRSERGGHTLQTTAVVHEAYLRLIDQDATDWRNRAHFFSIAARLIRRVLVDHARKRGRLRRGGAVERVTLLTDPAVTDESMELIDLHDALAQLEGLDRRQAQVVELRFFGGLSMAECAEVLDVSLRTIENDWRMARAWLGRHLREDGPR